MTLYENEINVNDEMFFCSVFAGVAEQELYTKTGGKGDVHD